MYVAAIIYLLMTLCHVKAETNLELNGKVAVVTGGAKGIGRAIADNCIKNGARVIIVDKNLTRGIQTELKFKSKYGENKIWFIHGDVTTDLYRALDIIFKIVRYVDILVNNAAILDENDRVGTINTNILAPVMWSHEFYEVMSKSNGGKGGIIMNIASIDSYTRDPFMWNYKATKFGLLGLTVGMGHELNFMSSGVKVLALNPSNTDTDMTKQQMVIDEQVDIFTKFRAAALPEQSADAVGQAAVTLMKIGTTGMAYTVEAGELFVSPDSVNITAKYLFSL